MTEDKIENITELSRTKKIIVGCLWFSAGFLFYLLPKVLSQFQETFDSFGTKLPALTKLTLSLTPIYRPIALLCFISIVCIFALNEVSFKTQKLYFRATLAAFFSLMLYFFIVIISMYLPIFSLSNVA